MPMQLAWDQPLLSTRVIPKFSLNLPAQLSASLTITPDLTRLEPERFVQHQCRQNVAQARWTYPLGYRAPLLD
jgi:hypothetical protein